MQDGSKTAAISVAVILVLVIGGGLLIKHNHDNNKKKKASTSQSQTMATESKNIVEIASANPDFSTLVTAVKAAGLVDTLSGNFFF